MLEAMKLLHDLANSKPTKKDVLDTASSSLFNLVVTSASEGPPLTCVNFFRRGDPVRLTPRSVSFYVQVCLVFHKNYSEPKCVMTCSAVLPFS